MNTQTKLKTLNDRLKSTAPTRSWLPDNGEPLRAGQVWTVKGGCGDQPAWHWLLLDHLDSDMFNCAPLATHGELAGPDDLFVPIDRAGIPAIVSFELECTLAPDALGECLGRLPDDVLAYVLKARADMADGTARNAYNWGLSYFGESSPSVRFHEAIAERIEQLQASVRQTVYVRKPTALEFPSDLPWSVFRPHFENAYLRKTARTADSKSTPCALIPAASAIDELAESAPHESRFAQCTAWDNLVPGTDQAICCEWFLAMDNPPAAIDALVYTEGSEHPVGKAAVESAPNGIRILLNEFELPGDAEPITDPEDLRIVVLVSEES